MEEGEEDQRLPLVLADLFDGLAEGDVDGLSCFQEEYWGKKILHTMADRDVLERIDEAFYHGEISDVLKDCRKEETNSLFSSEEMSDMASDLDQNKTTLILPFCFCPGAIELKSSFLSEMGDYGGDVEVGVYFSQLGGVPAPYHFDNNHNITIQLHGKKDWHCIPGNQNTIKNRGLTDTPKNYIEQCHTIPPTGTQDVTTFHMKEGSIIYLPPGFWHSVVPVEGESLSIDIRIGNVLHSKWISEVLFARLYQSFCGSGDPTLLRSFSKIDQKENGLSPSMIEQLEYVSNNVQSILAECRIPRPLPLQYEFTDGLQNGAELSFLESALKKKIDWTKEVSGPLHINPLVSVSIKQCCDGGIIIHMISVSSLTDTEYFRFDLYAPGSVQNFVLSCIKDEVRDVPTDEFVKPLVHILLYANVLYQSSLVKTGKRRKL